MKEFIKEIFRKNGIQIKRYPDRDLVRRMKIIETHQIDTLFDIGANAGQYASKMRKLGYGKRIISFEPLKSAFQALKKVSSKDKNWLIYNYALGNDDIKSVINVAGNSQSSSILNMLPAHSTSEPESKYIAKQEIEIKRIDSVFNSFCKEGSSVMIKIDTQGFEKKVIEGAKDSLHHVKLIQLEMSIIPLYESEISFVEMINYLESKGFQLFSLENGFSDSTTGQLLQVDGIFVQKAFADNV